MVFYSHFNLISNRFWLVFHLNFYWIFNGFPLKFQSFHMSTGFLIEIHSYFIEILIFITLKFQLYFRWISMDMSLKFQLNVNWFNFYFKKIQLEINWNIKWIYNGFPLAFHWNLYWILTWYPFDFLSKFIEILTEFLLAFHWILYWILTGFLMDFHW